MSALNLTQGDILQVIVKGQAEGQAVINVPWYRYVAFPGGPDPSGKDLAWFLQKFQAMWQSAVCAQMPTTYSVSEYVALITTGATNAGVPPVWKPVIQWTDREIIVGGVTDVGLRAGATTPTFEAVSMRKRLPIPGRGARGGFRFGPLIDGDSVNNVLQAGVLATWKSIAATFMAGLIVDVPSKAGFYPIVQQPTKFLRSFPLLTWSQCSSLVQAMIPSPYSSSQVSRKQRSRAL